MLPLINIFSNLILILGKISINKDDVAFIFHQESLLFLYVTVSTVVSIPSCFVNCQQAQYQYHLTLFIMVKRRGDAKGRSTATKSTKIVRTYSPDSRKDATSSKINITNSRNYNKGRRQKRVNMNKIIWIDKTKMSKKRRRMIDKMMISRDFWISSIFKIILLFNQNDISANFI